MFCIKLYFRMQPNYYTEMSQGRLYISFAVIHFSPSHTSSLCPACCSPGLRCIWKCKKGINQDRLRNKSSDSFQSFLTLLWFIGHLGLFTSLQTWNITCVSLTSMTQLLLYYRKSLHLKNSCCAIKAFLSFFCWSVAKAVLPWNNE